MKIITYLFPVILISLVTYFLMGEGEIKQKIEREKLPPGWEVGAKQGNRFPIFASNIIKVVYSPQNSIRHHASADTVFYFLEKAREANFSGVVANLTPSERGLREDEYTVNFRTALKRSNLNRAGEELKAMVYDSRLRNDPHLSVLEIFREIYSDENIMGFYVDEPYLKEFEKLSQVSKFFNDTSSFFFGKLFYVNLFGYPVFDDYELYVNNWIAKALPRLISFDHYAVWDDELAGKHGDAIGYDWAGGYFTNLQMFRDFSHAYNLPFWNWILVHKHYSTYSKRYYRRASASEIKYQIYTSLAYGSKGILYYNFWNPEIKFNNNGWNEEEGLLRFDGTETELYSSVIEINAKALRIGNALLNAENLGIYHKTNANIKRNNAGEIRKYSEEPLYKEGSENTSNRYGIRLVDWNDSSDLPEEELKNKIVLSIDNPFGIIGIFADKAGSRDRAYYLLCVNKNREGRERITVTINSSLLPSEYIPEGVVQTGKSEKSPAVQTVTLTLEPGDAELIILRNRKGG